MLFMKSLGLGSETIMDLDLDGDVSERGSQQRRLSLKQDGDDYQDDPEELIRDDARAVNCIRCVLIAFLILATVFTAVANCTLLATLEMRAFAKDFDAISTSLIHSFLDDLSLKMWHAYSISVTMTGANMLNSSVPFFNQLYQASRATTHTSLMVFSPLLHDEAARIAWESHALEVITSSRRETNEVSTATDLIKSKASFDQDNCETNERDELQKSPSQCLWHGEVDPSQVSMLGKISQIFNITDDVPVVADGSYPYSPTWQVSSAHTSTANLYNQMSDPVRREAINAAISSKQPVLTRTRSSPLSRFDELFRAKPNSIGPVFSMFYPIFNDLSASEVTATISFDFVWMRLLSNILPVGSEGIDLVLENSCGQTYTFSIASGKNLTFVGEGDLHDTTFADMKQASKYADFNHVLRHASSGNQRKRSNEVGCKYRLHAYPSAAFIDRYKTSTPGIVTAAMVVTFLIMSIVFFAYDRLVRRLQRNLMRSAVRYNSFLSTLFPSTVRSRLFNSPNRMQSLGAVDAFDLDARKQHPPMRTISFLPRLMVTPKLQLKNYLESAPTENVPYESLSEEPIADLFPHTTVFFADIAGFTAWSSEREPLNVFKLLETLYSAFDRIASRLGVFKVETVGDCYVAVTGLPEPQEDHAVIMAIFAKECLSSMRELTKSLESILGPSTASLALRVGMHSGPVIAGVLRGEKSRFQLFGDTMNTASRMESNGVISRIHVSQTTAELLRASGKADWITPREDHIFAKGKGSMQTYWVCPKANQRPRVSLSQSMGDHSQGDPSDAWWGDELESSMGSLVDWNVELLHKHLQKIVAHRLAATSSPSIWQRRKNISIRTVKTNLFENSHPRDEVVEALPMPEFSVAAATNPVDPASVRLPDSVVKQLRSFVAKIATTYHVNNAFHNFEHASHVAMSSSKLLNRIIAPDGVDYNQRALHKTKRVLAIAKEIHETTFGITSDPLLQFAAVFSALIHDVEHDGVPNLQLSTEMSPVALKYNNKTAAEQHSVDTAWRLLMQPQFEDLRSCIYQTEPEMLRFRQLVVNAVIATDIADESLQVWREARWNRAFHTNYVDPERTNRKASIVYAYILQASDVAHTMQHWHTYRKWNERLFVERYNAYQQGRSYEDPSLSWYEEETDFFDSYVIPLAEKLEECGVFGVSSHEYLSYAVENRDEWVSKGKEIVEEMVTKFAVQRSNSHARLPTLAASAGEMLE